MVWSHLLSDWIIFASYLTISGILAVVTFKHRRLIDSTLVVYGLTLFWMFVFWCGITHLVDGFMFNAPNYILSTYVKSVTAVVSSAAAWFFVTKGRRITDYLVSQEVDSRTWKEFLIANDMIGIAHVDDKNRFIFVSPMFAAIVKWNAEDLIGKTFDEMSNKNLDEDLTMWKEVLAGKRKTYTTVKSYKTQHGYENGTDEEVWTKLTVGRIIDPVSGEMLRSLSMIYDLTDQLDNEQRLKEKADELRESIQQGRIRAEEIIRRHKLDQ